MEAKETKLIGMESVLICERTPLHTTPSTHRSFPSIDEDIVGLEDDAEIIIQQLTGRIKELDIISIVGMPGLGKTTLARKVFNHFVDKHFDVRAWCSVSKEYSVGKVFSEILKQVVGNMGGTRDEDMPDKLRRSLMRKRFLIVLDDVWEVKAWEELQLSFPEDENGSRIVLTTRDEEVARQLKHHSNPYFLRFLRMDESWRLLKKKVFQGDTFPPELREAGLRVVKNCKGLPLVIVLIAGIIAKQRQVSLWHEIANDLSSHVLEEQNMKIIESSYDHLDDHLKPCLLYMGLFPEDYKYPVSDLLKLWIAENFVCNMDTKNAEEASNMCLNDLVNRSLVMVSKRRANAEIKYCSLHDAVRDFCLRKLTKERFMQLVVPYNPYQPLGAKEPRLCMYIHDVLVKQFVQYKYSLDKIPMLADLKKGDTMHLEFIAHPKLYAWNRISLFSVLDNFRLIRVLHLLDINLEVSWATAVQAVTHLTYLAVRAKEFDFQWVSHLLNLQFLRVVGNYPKAMHFKTSPSSIWKMQKLRHVDINGFSFTWEDNDRANFEESSEIVLPNLKTFGKCLIYLADMTPEFWRRFPSIEELRLHFVEPKVQYAVDMYAEDTFEVDMPNLEELPLQSLEVGFSHTFSTFQTIGWGSCVVFPSNLKVLSIHSIYLNEKLVSNIARLQNLETLKLFRVYFKSEGVFTEVGYSSCWDVSNYKFRALKYLKLQFVLMTEWKSLVDSAMNIKKEVEEMTGCDCLQVQRQLKKYSDFNFQISICHSRFQATEPLSGAAPSSSFQI